MVDMFLNFTDFVEQEAASPAVLGMNMSRLDLAGVVRRIATPEPGLRPGARMFVAPDLRHLALMHRDADLRDALEDADLVTCGGLALRRYALYRGCTLPGTITARAVVDELMHRADLTPGHRLFFLLDRDSTAAAVRTWAAQRDVAVDIAIAPAGLVGDPEAASVLARRVMAFGATILVLGIDAPLGELFAARQRERLPHGCWALCVGDAVRASLGQPEETPAAWSATGTGWLWRFARHSRQRLGHYGQGTLAFALEVRRELKSSATTALKAADPLRFARAAEIREER